MFGRSILTLICLVTAAMTHRPAAGASTPSGPSWIEVTAAAPTDQSSSGSSDILRRGFEALGGRASCVSFTTRKISGTRSASSQGDSEQFTWVIRPPSVAAGSGSSTVSAAHPFTLEGQETQAPPRDPLEAYLYGAPCMALMHILSESSYALENLPAEQGTRRISVSRTDDSFHQTWTFLETSGLPQSVEFQEFDVVKPQLRRSVKLRYLDFQSGPLLALPKEIEVESEMEKRTYTLKGVQ